MPLTLRVHKGKKQEGGKEAWKEKAEPRNMSTLTGFSYPSLILPDPSLFRRKHTG